MRAIRFNNSCTTSSKVSFSKLNMNQKWINEVDFKTKQELHFILQLKLLPNNYKLKITNMKNMKHGTHFNVHFKNSKFRIYFLRPYIYSERTWNYKSQKYKIQNSKWQLSEWFIKINIFRKKLFFIFGNIFE